MGYTSRTKLTVRYSETDRMGIVHHSRYYPWFECGRTDFTKQAGITYSEMEAQGVLMPLIESSAKYIEGAKYEDEITVETTLQSMGAVRCCFAYRVVRNRDSKVLATGTTTHAFVNAAFRPINLKKKRPSLYEAFCHLVSAS